MTRASDDERERALRSLQRHYAAGRLDSAEFEERAALATRARSRGQLRALFGDLPRDHGRRAVRAAGRVDRALRDAHVRVYAMVNGGLVAIWALTGAGDFWPMWSMAPWGAGLAGHLWCSRAFQRRVGLRRAATRQRSLYP